MEGNAGNDRLFGEAGGDKLFGDGWDITFSPWSGYRVGTPGPAGDDILDGGSGLDYFYGGAGRVNAYRWTTVGPTWDG
ncbi:MAG TPA: hypothetical protein VMZ71_03775 [Gemmataceae bacterium]|nr:hypothetical protein [Gemmataceae bacterium]